MTTVLESVRGDWDEDGFHLWLEDDEGNETHLRIVDTGIAADLIATVQPLAEWCAEARSQLAAYRSASPQEIERVLHGEVPTHTVVDEAELLRERADIDRKAARENR